MFSFGRRGKNSKLSSTLFLVNIPNYLTSSEALFLKAAFDYQLIQLPTINNVAVIGFAFQRTQREIGYLVIKIPNTVDSSHQCGTDASVYERMDIKVEA